MALLMTNPLAQIGGRETLPRIQAINALLVERALEIAKSNSTSGPRILLRDGERDGLLALTPAALENLRQFPILIFEPTPIGLAETIAMRDPSSPVEVDLTTRWLRLADDLVTGTGKNRTAALVLGGIRKADYDRWDELMTDTRFARIAAKAAIEWQWRFQIPLNAELFNSPNRTHEQQMKSMLLMLVQKYATTRRPAG